MLLNKTQSRRITKNVDVGGILIGSNFPIRVQSMLTCDTLDTNQCIKQSIELFNNGCEIVRITAQTKKHAQNLKNIISGLKKEKYNIPIVADIHFRPDAAMEAAKWVQKVRINPGNFVDKKNFKIIEYTDKEYSEELERIDLKFRPLVQFCKNNGVAMRIGTNHGSLSDRIMNRYGDTPHGMVESALEFARIARDENYHNFLFSMKASNPKVMLQAYRLLVSRLQEEGEDWNYPLHLGVTEAGDGEDGRIKSAIGIGSLLSEGIGDTIRVSLTEDAINEIPVAKKIIKTISPSLELWKNRNNESKEFLINNKFSYQRRKTKNFSLNNFIKNIDIGFSKSTYFPIRICIDENQWQEIQNDKHTLSELDELQPEILLNDNNFKLVNPHDDKQIDELNSITNSLLVAIKDIDNLNILNDYRLLSKKLANHHAIVLKDLAESNPQDKEENLLKSSIHIGSLICDGIGDAIWINSLESTKSNILLAYNILQSAGVRLFKADYVACPSCGRTLFDLQTTTAKVRSATEHLKGVRIAVMGCIVNGPGEMADADFGYVGGAPGKINLYVGKKAVQTNIPQENAVQSLVELIKSHGKWINPKK